MKSKYCLVLVGSILSCSLIQAAQNNQEINYEDGLVQVYEFIY